jgi:hypothetical protein
MDAHTILLMYTCGAAGLAVWLVARFPAFGPSTIMSASGTLLAALGVTAVVPAFVQFLVGDGNRMGGLVALLCLVLPTLATLFWATVRLLRAVYELFPGLR